MVQSKLPQAWYWTQSKYFYAFQFLNRYWLKIGLALFVLYLLVAKDISVQLKMSGAGLYAVQEQINLKESDEEPRALQTSFAIEEEFPVQKPLEINPVIERENELGESPAMKKTTKNFRNLTFVLSPDYAKRKGIPEAVVDAKKRKCRAYIKRYAPIAVAEMKKHGIPASIKLAQGLLESDVGDSRLARESNNHFGIKCFSRKCGKGHCVNHTDDSHKDFFRNYDTVWESYRAHSQFLQKVRYKGLKKYGTKDYKNWAYGLKKAGYATDKNYPKKLIRIIEGLELHKFDK